MKEKSQDVYTITYKSKLCMTIYNKLQEMVKIIIIIIILFVLTCFSRLNGKAS